MPASLPKPEQFRNKLIIAGIVGAVILAIILFFGIPLIQQPGTTSSSLKNTIQQTPVTPLTGPASVTFPGTLNMAPVTSSSLAAYNSRTDMTTAGLDYGVTISYPAGWRREETESMVVRDYGRDVMTIATIYSPEITSDRVNAAGSNPDKQKYTTLTIDVDPERSPDFEQYFNLATLAVQRRYEDVTITKRDVVLKISVTDTFPGYKSYELDFDAKDMRGKYIFTNADGTIYIFAYRNPSPYSKEVEDIYKSIMISPVG